MTQQFATGQVIENGQTRRVPVRLDAAVAGVAGAAGLAAWSLWAKVAGIELVVRTGADTQTVGAPSVVVSVLVASVLGIGLLRLLEARTTNGLRKWTIAAAVAFAVSLLGPLGAMSAEAGLALASMHAVVAAVLVLGLLRVHRGRSNSGVA